MFNRTRIIKGGGIGMSLVAALFLFSLNACAPKKHSTGKPVTEEEHPREAPAEAEQPPEAPVGEEHPR